MINRTKVKESTQIKPGDNGDVLVMKDNAPEWSTPSDAGLAEQANVDSELSKKQDKLVAGDNIHIDGNTISADGKPTPINIGTVISGEVPMVSNSGTDTDVVLNFVLPKGDKGDPGKDGAQVNNISPAVEDLPPSATGNMSLAAGKSARATEYGAVAIGSNARANSRYGVAIGFTATTNGTHGIAVGEATGAGEDGISLGWGADSNNQGVAIGRSSNATDEKSVAIGSFSFTSAPNTVSFGSGDAGSDPATRRLVNVTDPTDPQDAATKNYVDTKISEIPTGTQINSILPLTVDTPPNEGGNTGNVLFGNNVRIITGGASGGVGIGTNVITSHESVSIGNHAHADTLAIAIGLRSYAEGYGSNTGGIALGENARTGDSAAVAIGANSSVTRPDGGSAQYSVALGCYSTATEENVVSVGSGDATMALSDDMDEETKARIQARASAATRRVVNVTDPTEAQDAATKNYVDTKIADIPSGTTINSIAPLTVTTEPSSIDNSAVAIGHNARARASNAVAIGANAYATETNTVSFGSASDTRRIIYVTDPQNPQDAATKNYVDAQLTPINAKLQYVPENTNQILSQIETNAEKAQSAAEAAQTTAESKADQADLTALQTTVTQLQATVAQLQSQLNNLTLETEEI